MPYTYTLTSVVPATPQQVYEAWLDSVAHSEMTGGEAEMSGEIGAEVSAWDGYITGSNLELVPGERIVQSWRTSEFDDEHQDSIVTLMLEPVEEGTLLTLVHSNVPDEHRSYEEGGWESRYFEPMKVYFARLEQEEAGEAEEAEGADESDESEAIGETEVESPAPLQSKFPTERGPLKARAPASRVGNSSPKSKNKKRGAAKAKRKASKATRNKTTRALPKKKSKAKSRYQTKSSKKPKSRPKTKSRTKSKAKSKARGRSRR